ncbi:cysteine desulfurase [Luteimonas sp. FXH3W]|uniref:Cysteine desulfurase n=1 Tax=Aquilutibacter rugosus TaxID=3115820 RepID=A0ABU7V1J4_9GAMM
MTAPDWTAIRADFPTLQRQVHGKPLVYLDTANTSQKPRAVVEAMDAYYSQYTANVSRAVHTLGAEATEAYESARTKLAGLLKVRADELVLCSGTTFAINLVAYSYLLPKLQPDDVILVSRMEHHANIVPWQLMAERTGAKVEVIEILQDGTIDMDAFAAQLRPQVKLVAVAHVSNVLGTINPVREMAKLSRKHGIPMLVDGSQAVPHMPVDISSIGCDFYVFTGHKMLGPTGTGALWAKAAHLEAMPPFIGGGEMIKSVSFESTTFNRAPYKFEAGTPNIAGFIGLAAAVDYLQAISLDAIATRERELLEYATQQLQTIDGLRIFGDAADKASVISFAIDGTHAHDLATMLDIEGIAVRSGQHCAHPLLQFYGISATCRASLAFYNTEAEVDALVTGLRKVRTLLA